MRGLLITENIFVLSLGSVLMIKIRIAIGELPVFLAKMIMIFVSYGLLSIYKINFWFASWTLETTKHKIKNFEYRFFEAS